MNKPLVLGMAAGVALFLFAKVAKAQVTPRSKLGPPRYVDGYDRLPSLQAELEKRQTAYSIAARTVTDLDSLARYQQLTPYQIQLRADSVRMVGTQVPLINQLQAAINQIAAAGQM